MSKNGSIVFHDLATQRLNDKPIFYGQHGRDDKDKTATYELLGSDMAIIVDKIAGWCKHNTLNNRNIQNGQAWTYNSIVAWCGLLPWIAPSQMKRILQKLEESNWIKSGCNDKNKWDKVKWYALGEKAVAYFEPPKVQIPPIDKTDSANDACAVDDVRVRDNINIKQPTYNNHNNTPIIPSGDEEDPAINNNGELNTKEEQPSLVFGRTTYVEDIANRNHGSLKSISNPIDFQEVANYIDSKGLAVDAASFFSYYSGCDWKKLNGKSILNWKMTIDTIHRKNKLNGMTHDSCNWKRLKNNMASQYHGDGESWADDDGIRHQGVRPVSDPGEYDPHRDGTF